MTNFFGDLQGPSSEPFTSVPQPLELYLDIVVRSQFASLVIAACDLSVPGNLIRPTRWGGTRSHRTRWQH
jgi:hypothetical protein